MLVYCYYSYTVACTSSILRVETIAHLIIVLAMSLCHEKGGRRNDCIINMKVKCDNMVTVAKRK